MSVPPGNTYHHIQISGNARVLLGNAVGATTASTFAARADFVGQYGNSSLRPVANFVLRPRLHQQIKKQLHDREDGEGRGPRILVVYGLGGSGKSQLVLNYIRECRQDYAGVFWIEAGSKATIERDYVQIYYLLYGRSAGARAGAETVTVEDAVLAIKRWFDGREGRWLVVLDSADAIDNEDEESYLNLDFFLSDAPGVDVIITSRSATAQEVTTLEAVVIGEMEVSEATELF